MLGTIMLNVTLIQGLLFIIGIILVIVEMFIPGFGIPGITGGIALIVAIILTAETISQAIFLAVIIIAILAVAFTIMLVLLTKGKLTKFVLENKLDKESGYIGTEDLDYFLNKEGITTSVLRPSGTVDVNGVRMDVVSEGEFIEAKTKVKIVKVEGRRIVVKKC